MSEPVRVAAEVPDSVPEVTVIIPTKDRRRLLARTLHSVLAQRDVDLVVIVVDDGGSDDTGASVRSLGDHRVSVIRHPQSRGVSAARNTGVAAATSRFVAFVDDDDLWAPVKLRAELDALAATPGARWACTGSINIDMAATMSLWHLPPDTSEVAALMLRENRVPGGGSGVLAERDLVLDIGGFDEAISNLADWDFYIRLSLHSPMAGVRRLHLGYYVHPQGMAHDVARSEVEFAYLDVKYGHERRRRGVELNRSDWRSYLAGLAYNGGRRLTGMRLHAELALRDHRWRSLRSIAMGLAPDRLRLSRARRWVPPPPPPELGDEARTWLAPYVSGWLD